MGPPSNFGALDQTPFESRKDVLIYQTPAFDHGFEASGPISMTLYVSSDARDTDFTFKVIDVYPDGKAYNLTENIQRMRWREGYDKPPVWMHKGKVYKVTFQPIDISNEFLPGHRLRIEISSSNFPRFDRNLNTGGNNEEDSRWVVAHNTIHHDVSRPSSITFTVVPAVVGPEVR
jgi:putative CocE/NonD family hydrolase